MSVRDPEVVRWHDLECGGYDEDLALWRELAQDVPGPILDVGAGTGRVSLDLAALGHEVVANDVDGELLAALSRRAKAKGLDVHVLCADARELAVARRFGLVIVPMQTLQLLGGPQGRAAFYACVKRHLRPGGMFAAALADALDAFDSEHTEPPLPDMREIEGILYASRPIAVRDVEDGVVIERIRETVDRKGHRTAHGNEIKLDRVTAAEVASEVSHHGLEPLEPRPIAQTEEYVGSTVVIARA